MNYCYMDTPIGDLLLAGTDQGLAVIGFQDGSKRRGPLPDWRQDDRLFTEAKSQLDDYFAGRRQKFDLALQPGGRHSL